MNFLQREICLHNSFIVHSPFEHPLSFNDPEYCEIGYGLEIEVLIIPEVIISDEYLQKYTKSERKCIFDHDINMRFYNFYTQKNCEMECLSAAVSKDCGCVPYYFLSDGKAPICSINNIKCVRKWEFKSLQKQENYDMEDLCECYPACNSIKYNIEILSRKLTNASRDQVQIIFKFKDARYTPLRRFQQFTFVDFVSQSGSILGLFAGVSMLSIVELFYLFLIKTYAVLMQILTNKN